MAAVLAAVVLASAAEVVSACRPGVPLFDHAVLLADMLHRPPHLFKAHNEHIPVLPRLVFWLEARLTNGAPGLPVAAGVGALGVAAAVVTRAWQHPTRAVWAVLLFAAVLRPSLAWSVSWPTNVQYPLALLGASVAMWGVSEDRPAAALLGAWAAAWSSAEGLWAFPLVGLGLGLRGRRSGALLAVVLGASLVMWTTGEGKTGLRAPASVEEWRAAVVFGADLWTHPWSTRLWAAVVVPLIGWGGWTLRRSRKLDPALVGLALYGVGFAGLVWVGRWWLPEVHHRYALGGAVAVAGGVAAVGLPQRNRRGLALALGLALVMALESRVLGPSIADHCRAREPDGTDFWRGRSEDGAAAHPGFPPDIALELRAHLWRAGLYRVPLGTELHTPIVPPHDP